MSGCCQHLMGDAQREGETTDKLVERFENLIIPCRGLTLLRLVSYFFQYLTSVTAI